MSRQKLLITPEFLECYYSLQSFFDGDLLQRRVALRDGEIWEITEYVSLHDVYVMRKVVS